VLRIVEEILAVEAERRVTQERNGISGSTPDDQTVPEDRKKIGPVPLVAGSQPAGNRRELVGRRPERHLGRRDDPDVGIGVFGSLARVVSDDVNGRSAPAGQDATHAANQLDGRLIRTGHAHAARRGRVAWPHGRRPGTTASHGASNGANDKGRADWEENPDSFSLHAVLRFAYDWVAEQRISRW
jgi:hypothetical protein